MTAKTPKNHNKPQPKPAKRRTDWAAVERDYRTGKFTLRELETKHGANNGQISRKAKKDGWTQDLSEAIRQATNARLDQQIVSKEVSKEQQKVSNVVLAMAEQNTQVILGHRTDLGRLMQVQRKLLNQIEQAVENMADLAEVVEMVRNPDDNGQDKANDALKKVLGRPSLVDDLKKLADVDEKVRKGEREAFRIDAPPDKPAEIDNTGRYTDAERAAKMIYLLGKAQEKAAP